MLNEIEKYIQIMENLDSLVFARMKNIHKGEGQQIIALDRRIFTFLQEETERLALTVGSLFILKFN